MALTHNQNLDPVLHLLINCISDKCAPHILSLKDKHNLLFLIFLVIGLWNSYADCLFSELELDLELSSVSVPV